MTWRVRSMEISICLSSERGMTSATKLILEDGVDYGGGTDSESLS
jgi:hypothetical protein